MADVDGSHISALLLRMFMMYYPQLIIAGMIYKAIPPLYAIPKGKKNIYFTENIDLVRHIQRIFSNTYEIADKSGKKLSPRDLTTLFMTNADYLYFMEIVANTYAIPFDLMEMILNHYVLNGDKFDYKKLDKDIRKTYRFMNENEIIGDTLKIQGSIDEKHMTFINERTLHDCRFILDIIHRNENLVYKVNGLNTTIGGIMKLYKKVEPNGIQRYKGLGEMDSEELSESTMLGDRTLIRYTFENAKEEIEIVRQYESNPKMILRHVGQVSREDLLD